MSDRVKVVIGMCIVPEGTKGFADFGICYHNLPYDKLVAVEQAFASEADSINEGLKPLVKKLVAMGLQEVEVRNGAPKANYGENPNGVIPSR